MAIALLALLVAGCYSGQKVESDTTGSLLYAHDDAHHVSCWTWVRSGGGIACLPDSEVTLP